MKIGFFHFVFLCLPLLLTAAERDPFWPLDYQVGKPPLPEVIEPAAPQPTPAPGRELSDAELRALALEEAEKIRQSLDRRGTAVSGNTVYAYVQDKWVTTGDVITVEVEGNSYRLEILSLTTDNIELEPHRAVGPLQK